MRWKKLLSEHWAGLLLLVVSAVAYLPLVGQIGYTNDDWYLMYAAGVKGASVFREIFAVDRPLRALVMMPAYSLFGANPLYYNLSVYFFRVLSAFIFLWLLQMLWPKQRTATALMALLFLVYPGFLSQLNGIDYQSQMVGLAAAMLSLALTVRALSVTKISLRILMLVAATLLGWLYLGLVEYFLGFEAVRLFCVFLLTSRKGGNWLKESVETLRLWLPTLPIAGIFLIWRMFFFDSERGATDLGLQFGQLALSPLTTGLWWFVRLVQDVLNVLVLAWGVPLTRLAFEMRLSYALIGLLLAFAMAALVWWFVRASAETDQEEDANWRVEAFWLGFAAIVAGLLPVLLVNRHIIFPQYSRYALASSIGAVMILVAFFQSIRGRTARMVFLSLLVSVAVLTHFANNVRAAQETSAQRNFWWQVSWRVPQFEQGATLVVHYAIGATEEDYFVWGPANLIYMPEGTNPEFVQPGIHAAVLNKETIVKVLAREKQEFDNRRSIRTYKNYRNILILTQPMLDSCVQIVDGNQPSLSRSENADVRSIAAFSEIQQIRTGESFHIPPVSAFGAEPAHDWCYYYQKAALARQRGEWAEVIQIGEQAQSQGYEARDLIEWMPFLEAYAHEGEIARLQELSPVITADAYIAQQACQILGGMQGLSDPVKQAIQTEYCIE
jgi:hypothetical protein